MNREALLTASAAVVVVLALLAAAAVPGVVSPPANEEPTRPGHIGIADVTIQPSTVSGQTATLTVEAFLRHAGGPSENVSVVFRATDSESGLLETTRRIEVGTLSGEGETAVPANLTVEREGGYRISVLVYQGDRRVEQGSISIDGLRALTPAYARTTVGFADEGSVRPVSVAVERAGENRTELALSAWLTNSGDGAVGDLRVTFVLRQADSNVEAARASTDVGSIPAGHTVTADATVSVPAEYNYYIDAVLWKEGVIVDTARSVVNLDPRERISVNRTTREVQFEAGDFERGDGRQDRPAPTEEPAMTDTGASGPGFGVVIAVVALLGAALLARRWDR